MGDVTDRRDRFYKKPGVKLTRDHWTYIGPHPIIAATAMTYMKPGPNKILELGCSDGLLAERIFEMCSSVPELEDGVRPTIREYIGVDLSPMAIKAAHERFAMKRPSKPFFGIEHDLNGGTIYAEKAHLVLVANVLPWLTETDTKELMTRRIFEHNVVDDGVMIMVTLLTNPTHRSFHGDWPVHQRRARSTFITREPGEDGSPTEFVYQLDVVEKVPMKYYDPVLW